MTGLRYLSVCSGIEAATVAWHPLGWSPVAFSEIERFPSLVLAHHYGSNLPGEPLAGNAPPNLGDMTKFQEWPDYDVDLLVGGTPCQSFSVAGLRKGLADPRGNLALVYLGIADRYKPRWIVWENVPGVLSSNGGRDFGAFLGGLGQLGYGFAYRVLDAQYIRVDGYGRAVPQRRRRVFVVGYLGDWRRAAAVLFDAASLRGDPAPRRQAGQGIAGTIGASLRGGGGISSDFDGGLIAFGGNRTSGPIEVAPSLVAHGGPNGRSDFESETFVAVAPSLDASFGRLHGHDNQHIDGGAELFVAECSGSLDTGNSRNGGNRYPGTSADTAASMLLAESHSLPLAHALTRGGAGGRRQEDDFNLVAHTLRGEGFDASEDGGGKGTPIIPVAFDLAQATCPTNRSTPRHDLSPTIAKRSSIHVAGRVAVRRLMPVECERLQGFPDGHTDVPMPNGKRAADGPRYKACGNSMAVNAMRWLGTRIDMVRAMP